MYYPLFVLNYLAYRIPIHKAIPCYYLYMISENPAFLFAALGDYFLEVDYLVFGLYSFAMTNILLKNNQANENIILGITFMIQPIIIYTFGWYFPFVTLYTYTLVNLLSMHTWAAYLFVLSDILVLAQYLGFEKGSYIGLPIYWLSMYMFYKKIILRL